MTLKWDVLAAVWASKLPMASKAIMARLVDKARAEDAVIPQQFTPSLNELGSDCSASKSTVADQLDRLERGNWVKRERPSTADALARGEKTCYRLAIGDDELPPSKSKKGGGRAKARTGAEQGAVREPDTVESSPGAGQVRLPDRGGPGAGQPPVKEPDNPCPGAGHNNYPPTGGSSTHHSHQDPPVPPTAPPPATADGELPLPGSGDETTSKADAEAQKRSAKQPKKRATSELTTAPDPADFPITDAMRAYAAEKCPDVKDLEFHTEQFLLHHASKGSKFKNWVMAWQKWMRNQQEWTPAGRSRAAPGRDWRDVSGQDHSAWTKRHDPRDVSTPEAIETGWNRKGTTQ